MEKANIEDLIDALSTQADEMTLIISDKDGHFKQRTGLMIGLNDDDPDELVLEFTEGDDESLDLSDVEEICRSVEPSNGVDKHHYEVHTNGELDYSLDLIVEAA